MYYTVPQIIELARAVIGDAYQKRWARQAKIAESHLSDFLSGKRPPGPTILKALGFDVTPRYKRKRNGAHR